MSAPEWAELGSGGDRQSSVAALQRLSERGEVKFWDTFRLAPRPVSLRELTQMTKLDEKMLDPSADLGEMSGLLTKTLLGSTALATAWGALVPDDTLRFTGMYLIGGLPIALVAIGSTAPGLLALPLQLSQRTGEAYRERVCRHEAAHLLCAYILGKPIAQVTVDGGKPSVVVYDEQSASSPGAFVAAEDLPALAVVAMSGMVAEALTYGDVLGAQADLQLLNNLMLRCRPPMAAQAQQDTTRWAALMAWTILKKYDQQYEAAYGALRDGADLRAAVAAIEGVEANAPAASAAA